MNRSGWSGLSTLTLLKRWTRDVCRHERIIRAVWWKDPMGAAMCLRRRQVWASLLQGMSELGRRYQGTLYEIMDSMGVPEKQRTSSQVKVWQMTLDQVRPNPEPWRVPGFLWSACSSLNEAAGRTLPMRLKRKLMLRAFIEEIPNSEERSALLRLAYQDQGMALQTSGTDQDALEWLSRAYPLLHDLLLRNDKLAAWSDGAILPEEVRAMTYADFDDWLFEMEA
jgi:hypothetical protein